MLWRANLYIDEGGADWNNIYPWNAPETSVDANAFGSFKSGKEGIRLKKVKNTDQTSYSELFTEDNSSKIWYGENEWNIPETTYNGIKGGQIFKLIDYANIYNTSKANSVAYTYPESKTTRNARDTPFKFNEKIEHQRVLLANEYNIKGEKFKQPKSSWPNGKLVINDFNKVDYETYIQDYPTAVGTPEYPEKAIKLDSWEKITPPNMKWYKYSKTDTTINNTNYISYIPNLGLLQKYDDIEGSTELKNTSLQNNILIESWANKAAGTDCIGFVQNAANYGAYKWNITEEGLGGTFRVYPRTNADTALGTWIASSYSEFIVGKSNTEFDDEGLYKEVGSLKNVKPGDIMYFITPPNASGAGGGIHIALVYKITSKVGEDVSYNNIELIENTYNRADNIKSVINTRTLEHYILNIDNLHWRIVRLNKE